MKMIFRKVYFAFLIFTFMFCYIYTSANAAETSFKGDGTFDNPYIISSYNDLVELRKCIESGNTFNNKYFLQTQNIDLSNTDWIPIGCGSTNSFAGIYDGNGFYISNINNGNHEYNNVGLFSTLDGIVVNLGIESGNLHGKNVGAICGNINSDKACIVNCYNKASIDGDTSGGIVGNCTSGVIANCWNLGEIKGENSYGIVGSGTKVKIYSCVSQIQCFPNNIVSNTSFTVNKDYFTQKRNSNKFSLTAALSRYLFLGNYKINLKQWNCVDNSFVFSHSREIMNFIYLINYYLLPFLLILLVLYYYLLYKKHKNNFFNTYSVEIKTYKYLFGLITFFSDIYFLFFGIPTTANFGNILFLFLCNIIFFILVFWGSISFFKKLQLKKYIPLVFIIIIVIILELIQFDFIPRYDANIYYGSLIKGTRLFNYDLISYLGAFNCWKWIQGLILFIGPFEFMFSGKIIGVYIANILITIITLIILYKLLLQIYVNISHFSSALCCLIFMLGPYVLSMFTYLSMDWHIAFFSVWLVYAIHKKNDLGICFIGLLLCFTKITGMFFYSFILFFYVIFSATQSKSNYIIAIIKTLNFKKIVLWIIPVISMFFIMIFGDYFTSQNFYGTYVSDHLIKIGDINQIANTFLQAFIFGFRWIFSLLLIITVITCIKKRNLNKIVNIECIPIVNSLLITFVAVFLLLCLYASDANCPRYTTVFGTIYILLLPFIYNQLFKFKTSRNAFLVFLSCILFIQLFWTIDPSITLYCKKIYMGNSYQYKLAYNKDNRPGMNLTSGKNQEFPILGDIYINNLQINFYDELLTSGLKKISFNKSDVFYSLDIAEYEIDLSGHAYNIYYDFSSRKRTYSENEDTALLSFGILYSKDIFNSNYTGLPNSFVLIIPYRVYSSEVIKKLISDGYYISERTDEYNIYGKITIIKFVKYSF